MKILILGGTGFTGPYVVRALSRLGMDVRLFHRGLHPFPAQPGDIGALPAHVKKTNADLASLKTYRDVLRKMQFDVVLHMLAMNRGHAQQAIEAFSGYVGRIVVASSQDVYAAFGALRGKEPGFVPSPGPLAEEAPLRTERGLYDDSYEKLDVEETFIAHSHRLPVTLLRMPPTYGPGDPRHRFYPWVSRMLDARPAILLEPGMANFRWSHAYVENVAHAFFLALITPHAARSAEESPPPVRIYNVSERWTDTPGGGGGGIVGGVPTIGERVHLLARLAGYRGRVVVVPRDRAPAHLVKPFCFETDVVTLDAAIRRELGYQEVVGVEEGLRRSLDWQRTAVPEEVDPAEFDYAAEDKVIAELGLG